MAVLLSVRAKNAITLITDTVWRIVDADNSHADRISRSLLELIDLSDEVGFDPIDLLDHRLARILTSTPISTVATGPLATINPGSTIAVIPGDQFTKSTVAPPRFDALALILDIQNKLLAHRFSAK